VQKKARLQRSPKREILVVAHKGLIRKVRVEPKKRTHNEDTHPQMWWIFMAAVATLVFWDTARCKAAVSTVRAWAARQPRLRGLGSGLGLGFGSRSPSSQPRGGSNYVPVTCAYIAMECLYADSGGRLFLKEMPSGPTRMSRDFGNGDPVEIELDYSHPGGAAARPPALRLQGQVYDAASGTLQVASGWPESGSGAGLPGPGQRLLLHRWAVVWKYPFSRASIM
jgi:hypothetical protein